MESSTTPLLESNSEQNHEFWKKFPSGYKFSPDDGELIVYYLTKKVHNEPLPLNRMVNFNIYESNPQTLAKRFRANMEDDGRYYFFSQTDKKYPNGSRPNRSAHNGYWKATGAKTDVKYDGELVGVRNNLVFYEGKHPNGVKTDWIMHEFKILNPPDAHKTSHNILDSCVLCKIYYNDRRKKPDGEKEEEEEPPPPPPSIKEESNNVNAPLSGDVLIKENNNVNVNANANAEQQEQKIDGGGGDNVPVQAAPANRYEPELMDDEILMNINFDDDYLRHASLDF